MRFRYTFNPIQFSYCQISFYYSKRAKTHENRQIETEITSYLANVLKTSFSKIEIKLLPDIYDTRGFQRNKLLISPLYTFLIDTAQQNYSYNQIKNIKKAQSLNLTIDHNINPKGYLGLLQSRMDYRGLWGKQRANIYKNLLDLSHNCSFIKAYSIYSENQLIAFRMIILDQENSYAYDWFTASDQFSMKNGVNSYLLDYVIKDLCQTGIKHFDLCGANIPEVSKFKNDFGGDLLVYFFVKKKI